MTTATAKHAPRRGLGSRLLGSGLLDALTAPHGVDRYVELLRPTATLRSARARVIGARRGTPDSVTLTLRPNSAWRGFRAGQFVNVGVEIDGVRRTRPYSPSSSAASAGPIELTVKAHPEGLVSQHLLRNAREGDVVELSEAGGDFHLPDPRPDRVLLISGGSGITPVMSMLRTLTDEGHPGQVDLIHYAPALEHAIYRDELGAIAAEHPNVLVRHCFTREPGAGDLDGRFCRRHLATMAPDHSRAETFACGPPALLDAVRAIWAQDGLEERLHVESFLPPRLAASADEAEGEISLPRAGLRIANDGRSILEQAEDAGLAPQHGCRMGICHSCTCRKSAGRVRNALTGELSGDDEEDIQICVTVPVGDVELAL